MAKQLKETEVKDAEVVKVTRREFILKKNVGSNKDGSPKKAKGSKVKLTEEQEKQYKYLNLI